MRTSGAHPMYTTDVAVTDDGRILFTNKGSRDVTVYDGDGGLLERIAFDAPPTGIAVNGAWAYVTSSDGEGYLSKLSLDDYSVAYTVPTAMGACSPVVSADSNTVYVCNRYKGTLSAVSAATGEVRVSIAMLREPCAAAHLGKLAVKFLVAFRCFKGQTLFVRLMYPPVFVLMYYAPPVA